MASRRLTPSGAEDELCRFEPKPAFGFDRVRGGEAGRAGVLVDRHALLIGLLAQGRVRAHVVHDFAHSRQQPVVLQRGFARS